MADLTGRRRIAGALLSAAALATLGLVAAGCGASHAASGPAVAQTTTTQTGTNGSGNRGAAFQAFTACLKAHGITTPAFGGFGRFRNRTGTGTNPTPPPSGGTQTTPRRPNLTPTQRQAFTACRSKLPNGGAFGGGGGFRGGGSGPGGRTNNPAFTKYTNCLKQHGVTFGQSSSPQAFQKAQAACAKLRPSFGGGGGFGGGSSGSTTTGSTA